MKIDVKEFIERDGMKLRGFAVVQYEEIEMYLRVKQYKSKKLFIEMPRQNLKDPSIYLIRWPEKATSDKFQAEVLKQIEERWPGKLAIKEVVVE